MKDLVAESLQKLARHIEHYLKDVAGERQAFILWTAPFNKLGNVGYITNTQRKQAITILKEFLAWLEHPDTPNIPMDKWQ